METIIASAIAVLGTLLGAGITLVFQQRATDRGRRFARDERLRQERLEAYSAYGSAVLDLRSCLIHLWYCKHEQPPSEDPEAVRKRGFALRSSAQEALFKVQMLTEESALSRAADAVLDEVNALAGVDDRAQLEDGRVRTRAAIRQLIGSARQHL
ncbi:hypothetical protein ACIPRD_16385 [Streptomyces sp. NPDC090108]|uniref:hypothetical protein n=1 Tax=Streptomyces sp. NPDC090108 TaxID=3365947 RepID=UPI003810008B